MTSIVESAGVGCAFLDFDGDGWLDVYLVSGCWRDGLSDPDLDADRRAALAAATDRLYRNRGDGTFEDVTARAGLARPAYGMGVTVGDYDADGDPDLYVTNFGPNELYRNEGDGTFTEVAAAAGVDVPAFSVGAAFFDADRDGRLDLYVGNYVQYDPDYTYHYAPDGFPGPLAYAGAPDRLFLGGPGGVFTDATEPAGVALRPAGRAMGVGVLDYDEDGWPDVLVANDATENFLLHNAGDGTFRDRALEAYVAFGQAGEATAAMAVEIGDCDGDGRLDAFVPDMRFSCLYRNLGGGVFEDVSARSGVASASGQYVGWGAVFADFDLDGALDLYVSNGDVHHLETQEDLLLRGDGRGGFTDVSETAGPWARRKFVSRGVIGGDIDNDGDVDVLVTGLNDRPVLLRNDSPRNGGHWLGLELSGRAPNRDAIGAVVRVEAGGRTIVRQRSGGGSYLSHHDPRLHVGLGDAATVDRLEIVWPDGTRRELRDVAADRFLEIQQAEPPE
jgi:hypothetical protein